MRVLLASIATALLVWTGGTQPAAQQLGVLRIKVTILDADRQPRPVPRHALLISENPTAAAPQRVVTALDGTAELRLRPGNYTVESDRPLIFLGQAYQWAQALDVPAGRDTLLELTAGNAQIEAASAASSADLATAARDGADPSVLLIDWQHSVVAIWSPTRQGAGFLIDARGLIATNQRLVGRATSVEVQLSPALKVTARVLAADATKDVAILWIDPKAIAPARPVTLGYSQGEKPPIADKDRIFAISTPIDDQKSMTSGRVSGVKTHTIHSDIRLDDDSLGAPLFNEAGEVVAITTPGDEQADADPGGSRAVRIDEARAVIADAEKTMLMGQPPSGTPLPVEPRRPFEDEALREAMKGRAGSVGAYQVSAADFDISIITPVLTYAARHQGDRASERERGKGDRNPEEMPIAMRALEDFANWSGYVREYPPVLMIRATPKLVESFWKTVGRVAASTQGVQLPPFKRVKAGFARMRVYCGEAEVTPIHPFKIEQRVDASNVIYEGLYVFDPAAIGPHCATVKLMLYSDKDPEKPDPRVVDAKLVQQIWQDFAPYRVQLQDVR
jgi:S1-C subfamily serine protease